MVKHAATRRSSVAAPRYLALALLLLLPAHGHPPAAPIVERWHTEPAAPNRSILATFVVPVAGTALEPQLCHRGASSAPVCVTPAGNKSETSISIVVPHTWPVAEYRFRLCVACNWAVVVISPQFLDFQYNIGENSWITPPIPSTIILKVRICRHSERRRPALRCARGQLGTTCDQHPCRWQIAGL